MKRYDDAEDPRRRVLIQALAAGLFAATAPARYAAAQGAFGSRPTKLPEGQSIFRITGQASVNDQDASLKTRINPGDTVKTGANSEIIFVVNDHSMIVRADSQLQIQPQQETATSLLVGGLRLLTGKLLSVSRNRVYQVSTTTATIGIRGTGFYVEADPELTYFCTCYGVAEVAATNDPTSQETVTAQRHDRPLYITGAGQSGQNVRDAPFINHTDQELSLIETLVGRTTPYVFGTDQYQAPRRGY